MGEFHWFAHENITSSGDRKLRGFDIQFKEADVFMNHNLYEFSGDFLDGECSSQYQ